MMTPREVWASADFAPAGAGHVIVGERLARSADIHPGERVLDVAAGSGNAALAAARRGARVTATDFVESFLAVAAYRALDEGLPLQTRVADAQDLPFEDGSFDVVLSTFGVMFAPDQQRAADELLRVCRPGGRIGLTAWTPSSLIASAQRITMRRLASPPAPGQRSPLEWGTEPRLKELFGDHISDLRVRTRSSDMCGDSAAERIAFNRKHMGPTNAAFARLDPPAQDELAAELAADLEQFNRATDGTLVAAAEYLEAVAQRR
jgi:SAM-dependent methyltransferase